MTRKSTLDVTTAVSLIESPFSVMKARSNQSIPMGLSTSEAVMRSAGIDWDVELRPTFSRRSDGTDNPGGRFHVVRLDNEQILGDVGERYNILQYRKAFDFVDGWLQDGQMQYHQVGVRDEGARAWFMASIGEDFLVNGRDPIHPYFFFETSHDGSCSVRGTMASERLYCSNQLPAIYRDIKTGKKMQTSFAFRHTPNMEGKLDKVQETLGIMSRTQARLFELFGKMADTKATDEIAESVGRILLPEPDAEASDRLHAEHKANRLALWQAQQDPTVTFAGGVDNLWGAYNWATLWIDHLQPMRNRVGTIREERQLFNSLLGNGADMRQSVFDRLTVGI